MIYIYICLFVFDVLCVDFGLLHLTQKVKVIYNKNFKVDAYIYIQKRIRLCSGCSGAWLLPRGHPHTCRGGVCVCVCVCVMCAHACLSQCVMYVCVCVMYVCVL